MTTFFVLYDSTTANLVTEFDTEEEAIELLSQIQDDEGDEAILEYALFQYEDDRPTLVAREHDLVLYLARARERGASHVVSVRA